ncbi:MAG: hypothetical protein HYX53_10845 [Chloroflexi bacterium]|nr:hypothetical protein [Chloroflexota bacterium]
MRVLSLFLPRFPIQVALRQRPHLEGRPVAVLDGHGEAALVAAASCEATAKGVTAGMPAAQARERCQAALFLPDNSGSCFDELDRIASILRLRATPLVAIGGVDHLFVDLDGIPSAAEERELALRLMALAASWCRYSLRAGVGNSRREALEAARAARRPLAICAPPREDGGDRLEPPILPATGTIGVTARSDAGWDPVEARAAAERLLARAGIVLTARGESFREVAVHFDRAQSATFTAVLRLRNPRHSTAGVLDELGTRLPPEALSHVTMVRVELARLGPSVQVQPLDPRVYRAPNSLHGAERGALRRAS